MTPYESHIGGNCRRALPLPVEPKETWFGAGIEAKREMNAERTKPACGARARRLRAS